MYKYCNEILKYNLPIVGLEPSIQRLQGKYLRPLSHSHFHGFIWEIKISKL